MYGRHSNMDKTVQVRDLVIGEGRPKICIPVMHELVSLVKEYQRALAAKKAEKSDRFPGYGTVCSADPDKKRKRKKSAF